METTSMHTTRELRDGEHDWPTRSSGLPGYALRSCLRGCGTLRLDHVDGVSYAQVPRGGDRVIAHGGAAPVCVPSARGAR